MKIATTPPHSGEPLAGGLAEAAGEILSNR